MREREAEGERQGGEGQRKVERDRYGERERQGWREEEKVTERKGRRE